MSTLPRDIYGKIIKYASPMSGRSLIATSKLPSQWSQDNRNWFLLIDEEFRGLYNDEINYRNYYYYIKLISEFFPEDYNNTSDYENRYILLREYIQTGEVNTIDVIKDILMIPRLTQDDIENLFIHVMKKDNIRFYIKFEPEIKGYLRKNRDIHIDKLKIAYMVGAYKIINYLTIFPNASFEGSLPVVLALNIQYLLNYGDFTYNAENLLENYPYLLQGIGTDESLEVILLIYAFLHIFVKE